MSTKSQTAAPIRLEFSSAVRASPAACWRWITSAAGINAELRPVLRMRFPTGIENLDALTVVPRRPLFRSSFFLLGIVPIDYSHVTLLEIEPGVGFVELSQMGSMKRWRHERRIEGSAEGSVITDRLEFEPRLCRGVSKWLVQKLFEHRHRSLRSGLNQK